MILMLNLAKQTAGLPQKLVSLWFSDSLRWCLYFVMLLQILFVLHIFIQNFNIRDENVSGCFKDKIGLSVTQTFAL